MGTDWGKILSMKIGRIVLFIIITIIVAIVSFGLFTNKHIKIGCIEFNERKEDLVRDTIDKNPTSNNDKAIKTNTTVIIDKKNPAKPTQKIEKEGSGIQNNAPNYGNQAGRDINNYGIIPRKISENMLVEFYKIFPQLNTPIAFEFIGGPDGEMKDVKKQIIKLLRNKGYTNIDEMEIVGFGSNLQTIALNPQSDGGVHILIPPASKN